MNLFLAVEEVIPADHPAAILSVPLGLLFFGGSVFLLLWSNYGAKKAAAMYGTAFFGFAMLLGFFFWFGGPGIPSNLGVTHLPGQTASEYAPEWYAFEPGSERAGFFPATNDPDSFDTVQDFLGLSDLDEDQLQRNRLFGTTVGDIDSSVGDMQDQYLPVDDDGIAQIGAQRREGLEEAVTELIDSEPALQEDGVSRAPTFYSAEPVGDVSVTSDEGLRVATQRFRTLANFVDADGVPILRTTENDEGEEIEAPWPVGEETDWFAFQDPGAEWFPSALWTIISMIGFGLSLFALDRFEMRDKVRELEQIEEPEDVAVPVGQ